MTSAQPSGQYGSLSDLTPQGYRPGISQAATSLCLSWQCPPRLLRDPREAILHLDAWLSGPLAIVLPPEPQWLTGDQSGSPKPIRQGVWRLLQLASELLRLIQIPVFDPGIVQTITADPQANHRWRIRALVPVHEHQPQAIYVRTYSWAAELIARLLETEIAPAEIERIHAWIEVEHIQQLSSSIAASRSTLPVLRRALAEGIPFRHLGLGIYQLGWGHRARRIMGGANDLDSAIGSRLCQSKQVAAALLRTAGLPIPIHREAASPEEALSVAEVLGWPVVVKPADRDRGEGVSVNITTPTELHSAWLKARTFSANILVERHVAGTCHRLHVMSGQVISVSKRLPKAVCGDGHHSVRDLIAHANRVQVALPPWQRLKPFPSDPLAAACLGRQGLDFEAVPAPGEWACLRPFSSIESGGELENCTDTIHPVNVEAALLAARVCGLNNAGVDMISLDISEPWHRNGAVINEINFAPQTNPAPGFEFMLDRLLAHHFPARGRIPVTVYLGGRKAFESAQIHQRRLGAQGVECSLVAFDRTLDPAGEPVTTAAVGLFGRCLALLCDPRIEALAVAVQTGEFLSTGLPFDRPDQVIDCGDALLNTAKLPQALARARLSALLAASTRGTHGSGGGVDEAPSR